MSDSDCTCLTKNRGGRHRNDCPAATPSVPTPSADASFAEIAKYLAGNLQPASEAVANVLEAEINCIRAGVLLSGSSNSSGRSGMVAKHLILNYRLITPHSLNKTQGRARERLQMLCNASRRAAAEAVAQRHQNWRSPGDMAVFGAEFTLQWFIGALDNTKFDWNDQYMMSVVQAMEADSGTIGRLWRGETDEPASKLCARGAQ